DQLVGAGAGHASRLRAESRRCRYRTPVCRSKRFCRGIAHRAARSIRRAQASSPHIYRAAARPKNKSHSLTSAEFGLTQLKAPHCSYTCASLNWHSLTPICDPRKQFHKADSIYTITQSLHALERETISQEEFYMRRLKGWMIAPIAIAAMSM